MLEVRDLCVDLDHRRILDALTLDIAAGEIVAILGPSGSGKSTLLRSIAGLVEITAGDILWQGRSVTRVPTHQRNFGLMFQGYALFPHLDVAGNVGFGLRMTGEPDVEARVARALSWVGLDGFQSREVDSLSGGEQQRVALARTLAPEPELVMLDEPLGALDRNLRQRLVEETRRILEEREVTSIVVTHDRDEAVAMSDRLSLMRAGSIVQTGTIDELIENPGSDWVRDFLS